MVLVKRVCLVSCAKSKLDVPAPGCELYTSPLFQKSAAFAIRFCEEWGILSAKYGLVMPDQVVGPYDEVLADKSQGKRIQWTRQVNDALQDRWPDALFVVLAGPLYAEAVKWPVKLPAEFPLEGMQIGERLQWLNAALQE